jgi:hypothetical protein
MGKSAEISAPLTLREVYRLISLLVKSILLDGPFKLETNLWYESGDWVVFDEKTAGPSLMLVYLKLSNFNSLAPEELCIKNSSNVLSVTS